MALQKARGKRCAPERRRSDAARFTRTSIDVSLLLQGLQFPRRTKLVLGMIVRVVLRNEVTGEEYIDEEIGARELFP